MPVAADKAIADAFSNRFYIPLDFELLESHMAFYQSALGDRLEYELTFNDYSRVIQATGDADASYDIENISLEYDMITQSDLVRMIDDQYKGRLAILYDRVLRYRKISKDKSDTLWNITLNVPARSMKGILMLFENVAAQQPFARNTEAFYNPKITKVEVTIEGVPNQLFSQGMRAYQMWDEAKKLFAASPGSKRHPDVSVVPKDLVLADVFLGEFLTSKYSLWLDLRTTDDDRSFDTSWSYAPQYDIIRLLDPGERLHDYLRAFYEAFKGEPTLYIINDCSATKVLTRKKDMLSKLAFSGRHADLTQKYNAVLKDLREQTRRAALFHCKDRDSFEDCLRENNVIPTREQRALVRQQLAETRLVLNTDQPASYMVLRNHAWLL